MKVIITESQTTTWNLKIPRKKLTAIPSALRGFLLRSSLHDQRNNTKTNILVILIQHTRQTHVTVEAYQCSRLCSMEWPVGVKCIYYSSSVNVSLLHIPQGICQDPLTISQNTFICLAKERQCEEGHEPKHFNPKFSPVQSRLPSLPQRKLLIK